MEEEEEQTCAAVGTVTVPETTGDLPSIAGSWACALFIENVNVLLIEDDAPPPQ